MATSNIKIRIGKDIEIKWTVLVNNVETNIEDYDLKLFIKNQRVGQPVSLPFTVKNNVITATFEGRIQYYMGLYDLTLWVNKGKKGQSALDKIGLFELVKNTELESSGDGSLITNTSVLSTSNLSTEDTSMETDGNVILSNTSTDVSGLEEKINAVSAEVDELKDTVPTAPITEETIDDIINNI